MTSPARPIRVLLADDHGLVRAGLRALLEPLAGLQVVAEAADGREALGLLGAASPDVVLMDIGMRGLNGLEATAQATQQFPRVRVLVLSMHAAEEYVLRALRLGAAGYLLKDAAPAELEIAIRAVARGESYLSPGASRHLVRTLRDGGAAAGDASGPLTPRQREVLQLIAEGQSTKAIARLLDVSIKTVESHRAQLMERLDVHDVAGLVRYAIRTGVVTA